MKIIGKFSTIIVLFTLINTSFSLSSSSICDKNSIESTNSDGSYIIERVPYVSQETNLYCWYACITMIFQYYGINTSLEEILHNTGLGYSLLYPKDNFLKESPLISSQITERVPTAGIMASQSELDKNFLAKLYGLTYSGVWVADTHNLSEEETWNEYWSRVKENITNNIPVMLDIFALTIPAYQDFISMSIPNVILDMFPKGGHDVLILGFNETNGIVVLSDPAFGFIEKPELGNYTYMPLELLRKYGNRKIFTFEINESTIPLSEEERYSQSHKRNIERMKGNKSVYDEQYDNYNLGINALTELKNDFQSGIKNRFITIYFYKKFGVKQHNLEYLLNLFLPESMKEIWNKFENNKYSRISLVKNNISEYLLEKKYLSPDCIHDLVLLEQECKNWSILADLFDEFVDRGTRMTLLNAIKTIKKMENVLDSIIEIEQKIIDAAAS